MKDQTNVNTALFLSMLRNTDPSVVAKVFANTSKRRTEEKNIKDSSVNRTDLGDTASKLGPLESDTETTDLLYKIYGFLKKSNENKIKLREFENNYKEENEFERKKQHDALMKALSNIQLGGPTATKIEEETNMSIFDIIGDILMAFGGAKTALNVLARMGAFFLSPFGAAVLGVSSVAALLLLDKKPEETNKMLQNALNPAAEVNTTFETIKNTEGIERRKQNLLAERPRSKKSANLLNFKEEEQLQRKYLEEEGWDPATGLTNRDREQGFTGVDENGKLVKKAPEQTTSATEKKINETEVVEPTSPNAVTTVKAPESAEAKASESKTIPVEKTLSSTETVVPQEIPVSSERLNRAMEENVAAKLNETLSEGESVVVNNSSTSSGVSTSVASKPFLPAVRNLEPTLQRMIYDSTRVV